MKKALVVASVAFAFVFAASAGFDPWFTGIGTGAAVSDMKSSNGSWTFPGTDKGDYEVNASNALEFDLDDGYAVQFNADAAAAPDTNTVTRVTVKGVFTPVTGSLPTESEMIERGAQVGFVVVGGETPVYKAWTGGSDWLTLTGTPDTESETTLVVTFDYHLANSYTVSFGIVTTSGGTATTNLLTSGGSSSLALTSSAATSRKVSGISCYGSGTISVADGEVELGIAEVGGVRYGSLAAAAAVAESGQTIMVRHDTEEDVTLPDGITIADANGHATGTLTANGALTVAVKDSEVGNGASGEYTLNLKTTGSGTVTAALVGNASANKEVVSTDKVGDTLKVTTQTKAELLTAVKPDTTEGNTGVALAPAANVGKLRAFIKSDTQLNAIDVAATVSTDGLQTGLQAPGGNGLEKWKSYALGIKTTEPYAVTSAPAGDTETAKIKLAIPAATNAWVNGSSYAVTYKINDTAAESLEISSLPQSGNGTTYSVKAVLTPAAAE